MKVLLHTCCAPCSIACIDELRAEGIEPTALWYNPNIHPYVEYRTRRDTFVEYARSIGLQAEILDEYGLREFVAAVSPDFDHRCGKCYRMRMRRTAEYAAQHGYDAFTTTLFISPYQDHELLRSVAEEESARAGAVLLYRDFRSVFRAGQDKARELGLYMQKYCGCVFSEEDRYSKARRRANAALRAKEGELRKD